MWDSEAQSADRWVTDFPRTLVWGVPDAAQPPTQRPDSERSSALE